MIALAGGLAETILTGKTNLKGASGDVLQAMRIAAQVCGIKDAVEGGSDTERAERAVRTIVRANDYLNRAYLDTYNLLAARWPAVVALASALLEEATITGAALQNS